MPISNSHLSYGDCYGAMDRALEDSNGIRVAMPDMNSATFFRMRLHQARSIDRKRNIDTYEEGHPMRGASIYDSIVVRIKEDTDDRVWVYLEKMFFERLGKIENLSEIEGEWEEIKQIEAPAQPALPMPRIERRRF